MILLNVDTFLLTVNMDANGIVLVVVFALVCLNFNMLCI